VALIDWRLPGQFTGTLVPCENMTGIQVVVN